MKPEHIASELGLGKVRNPRRWAHRLIARHEAGERVNEYALTCALQVVGQSDNNDGGQGVGEHSGGDPTQQSGIPEPRR